MSLVSQNVVLCGNGVNLYHTMPALNNLVNLILKTLWEKEKILEIGIFSSFHNFFNPVREKSLLYPRKMNVFYIPAKRTFSGVILESACLSVCVSVRPSVHLCTKYYFLSMCWQGYQVTFSNSSSFSNRQIVICKYFHSLSGSKFGCLVKKLSLSYLTIN